ncbi:MAG TPA: bifunctional UDP-N-acetylmuramoyl-L-alanyl-D-glutamate--2,6-diaminopimelate ligase MurE/UDP-N-acetylmuramoyl-tripeptide--D-alanyl-D-alanine ligase MurF [Caldimonas sp.]|jgi:murE/murF fusion protein|nr:bifunctional UDP-N-acetylmuramoyl-L-alanyl-D-glutamate--2,6-diaminopimelate ligase MurE/UDP-N-acetylmuramoyl-tripeptide--D-alanyl-D-alanine ligase MurF [Caldimonas sp.]HEX2539600.1 bifunctional UDP-N-acetylmuramoyl-L-alanyl-D-glutamate--2,6-diaminopimelate ligase MurE/UDP-N-acetylmuramoyl-tripeptide--D-alanyl-D-alanine ligase MurF [Caldimonas sp.]
MARLDSREAAHAWLVRREVRALASDSRRVEPGSAFIAWPGHVGDGRAYVGAALAAGAGACLVEAEGVEAFGFDAEPRVGACRGLKAAAGDIASRFLEVPSARLEVIAITGTNGKTSTTWWVAQALGQLGRRCGVIGTLGIGVPPHAGASAGDGQGEVRSTGLTTPDPVTLQKALRDFVDGGFAACAIEASSIGIAEHRLAGTRVAIAVFTNFTQDHLDYHGDMAAYWQAKAQLFAWPGLKAAVVNLDDAHGVSLADSLAATSVETWTISSRAEARLRAVNIEHRADGLAFEVVEGEARVSIATPLIGDFNVVNVLCVVGSLRAMGVGLADSARACAGLRPVPGRMQRVVAEDESSPGTPATEQPEVVVDYAHTPDALEKALAALAPLARQRGGTLWCVFGCGGNRDPGKRPLMGAIACRLAGRVVLTSDNPRLESPERILAQILAGAIGHEEVDVIENRAEAIQHAVGSAGPRDVVLIAGKGHEDYQDAGGQKTPFSDASEAASALRRRTVAAATGGAERRRGKRGPTAGADRRRGGRAAAVAAERRLGQASPASGAAPPAADVPPMATLGELAALLRDARLVGDPATPIGRVHSDTRSLAAGDLFVALRGERFDAHEFLASARAAGAVAAIAEHGLAAAGLPGLEVGDTRAALGALGAAWRRRFQLPLVAVAGSNGKTTVTQMIASIFRAWHGDAAFATQGNLNNDIGVPLTLLRLRDRADLRHRVAVVELGMNHPGEIARLAAMAAPSVGLVNNAQREHLEFMADVDAVARENGAVIAALDAQGVAVFPADDAHAPTWRAIAGERRVFTFALDAGATVSGQAQWHAEAGAGHWSVRAQTPAGVLAFELHVAGIHNVRNALAATAGAMAAGCPLDAVAAGLARFAPVRGRSHVRRIVRDGVERTLVDDSYNANPDSVRAAIDVLAALPGPRWLVLGDMGEVGDQGPAFHREVGAFAAERRIEHLWAAGPESASTVAPFPGARRFADAAGLIAALGEAPAFASVLVKGSRFMQMERVVAALTGEAAASDSPGPGVGGAHAP